MYKTPSRPRTVTMMLWVVFLLGGWNGGRAIAISLNSRTLASFNITPDPQLRLGSALIWAVLFFGIAIALWRRRPFTRRAVPLLLSLYAIYELGLFIFYAQSPSARYSLLVNALFYGLTILFSVWALNRTAVRAYFNFKKT